MNETVTPQEQAGLDLFDHYTRAIRIAMAREHADKHPADRLAAEIMLTRYYLLKACQVAEANEDPTPTAEDVRELEAGRAVDWQITRDIEERFAA